MNTKKLYPFLFEPYYKNVMWGGRKFSDYFHLTLPDASSPYGEAWCVCDRDDHNSVVTNGPLAGTTLRKLIEDHGTQLLGTHFQGGVFPLLVKLLDAKKRLSLQVHPDDDACKRIGGTAESKTEMWYVLQTDPEAKIFAGLSANVSEPLFWEKADTPEIEQQLQTFYSQPGDAFFIRAGTVHAIGEGNLILEIQQNSDTTYRISDWGRLDLNGKPRKLHIEESRQCIDFAKVNAAKVDQEETCPGVVPLVRCEYFMIDKLLLNGTMELSTEDGQSFHMLSAASGTFTICQGNFALDIPAGATCLIPADFGKYTIKGNAEILETRIA